MDELIAQKRTGVNLEVLKALGGQYGSDLDVLMENASIEKLKDALSFKNLKPKQEVNKKTLSAIKESNSKKNIKSDLMKVEFTSALNSKKAPGEILVGEVILDFVCKKTNNRFFKIKTDKGVFFKKADVCKAI